MKPLRIRIRITCDAGMVYDYWESGPDDAIRKVDHWLIHVGVPLGGHRFAPPPWRQTELVDALTLSRNRLRQAAITKEIAELVGGAEALK